MYWPKKGSASTVKASTLDIDDDGSYRVTLKEEVYKGNLAASGMYYFSKQIACFSCCFFIYQGTKREIERLESGFIVGDWSPSLCQCESSDNTVGVGVQSKLKGKKRKIKRNIVKKAKANEPKN